MKSVKRSDINEEVSTLYVYSVECPVCNDSENTIINIEYKEQICEHCGEEFEIED